MKTIAHNFKFQAVLMDPVSAQKLLDTNHELQRKQKSRRIQQYTKDMVDDNWPLTYECIALDENDKLINGQNRLIACIRAGKPVPMMIVRNVPTNNMPVIDTGLARNAIDASVVVGLDLPNRVKYVQTARRMSDGLDRHCTIPSNMATLEFMETHKEALDFAFEALPGNIVNITTASVRAVIARAYYTCSKTKLKEFGQILKTGISSNLAVIHFRNWLLTAKNPHVHEVYAKTESALYGFIHNEVFKGKLHGAKEELLLPGNQYTS